MDAAVTAAAAGGASACLTWEGRSGFWGVLPEDSETERSGVEEPRRSPRAEEEVGDLVDWIWEAEYMRWMAMGSSLFFWC